jgi:CotH kinase protein
VTDAFLQSRFGDKSGGLWKDSFGAGLTWQGANCSAYPPTLYQPANAYAQQHCEALVHLIDVIANTPDALFEREFSRLFDVELFMRTYAVEVLTGNWDGILDGNNLYLYYDRAASPPLWRYWRHDLDVSVGVSGGPFALIPGFIDTVQRGNVYRYGQQGGLTVSGRFLARLMSVPSYRATFERYLSALMDGFYDLTTTPSPSAFVQRISAMHHSAAPLAIQDYWHRIDSMLSFGMFRTNLAQRDIWRTPNLPNATHNLPILFAKNALSFAKIRQRTARQQLAAGYPGPVPHSPPPAESDPSPLFAALTAAVAASSSSSSPLSAAVAASSSSSSPLSAAVAPALASPMRDVAPLPVPAQT